MDFELTDDQLALQEVVRDVVGRECPTSLVRAVVEDRVEGEVDALWKTYVQLDWPSLTVAEDDGGMGATAVELALTLEELGRVADPTAFLVTTSQFVPLVSECGDAEQRRALLGAVCAGTTGAVAFDPGDLRAEPVDDGWRLTGTARHVMDGDRADEIAVVAGTDSGPGVFVVPAGSVVSAGSVVPAGSVSATRNRTFDATLHLAEVRFDGVTVEPKRCLVGPEVAAGVDRARLVAVTGLAATMVGASQRILDLVVDHVRSRHQFGQPIGSFQAVKHMIVDVYIAIERARALCHFAALTIAEDDDRQVIAASMAKAAAGDCQRIAAQHGVQLFGGLGFTWENDMQMFVRRAKAGELLFGSTSAHRATVARSVLTPAAGATSGEVRR